MILKKEFSYQRKYLILRDSQNSFKKKFKQRRYLSMELRENFNDLGENLRDKSFNKW